MLARSHFSFCECCPYLVCVLKIGCEVEFGGEDDLGKISHVSSEQIVESHELSDSINYFWGSLSCTAFRLSGKIPSGVSLYPRKLTLSAPNLHF
jgi:hypothetical protein